MNSKHLHNSRETGGIERWRGGKRMSVRLGNWQQETSPATRHGAVKKKNAPLLNPRLPRESHPSSHHHTHRHMRAQPALFEMFVLLMCSTLGRIGLNARRPQTLRSALLIGTNHSPSLARAGSGSLRGDNQREGESERKRECE